MRIFARYVDRYRNVKSVNKCTAGGFWFILEFLVRPLFSYVFLVMGILSLYLAGLFLKIYQDR
ncbi:MAG: hypothetical protein COA99_03685 [Moraxellaceae bacterium]|nr:MAG: hypothetical protein COA99_03685 [Moraxellaceae bacterium]